MAIILDKIHFYVNGTNEESFISDFNRINNEQFETYEKFIEKLYTIPITLIPYKDDQVVFLYPKLSLLNVTIYDDPIYYSTDQFSNAADIIGAIENRYRNDDEELRDIIFETGEMTKIPKWYNLISKIQEEDKIDLMSKTKTEGIPEYKEFDKMMMIHPGIYKIILY